MLENGPCHDLYAIDAYYHQSCYIKFARLPVTKEEEHENQNKELSQDILDEFLAAIKKKILHQKDSYLLSQLLKNYLDLSKEQDCHAL